MLSFFSIVIRRGMFFFLLFVCFQQFEALEDDGPLAFTAWIDAQARNGANPLRMRRKREDVGVRLSVRDERT